MPPFQHAFTLYLFYHLFQVTKNVHPTVHGCFPLFVSSKTLVLFLNSGRH
jgi:hypothetical protein